MDTTPQALNESSPMTLGLIPAKPPSPWRRFETIFVIGLLFLGGVGTGYFLADRQAEIDMARMRDDHQKELARALAERAVKLGEVESRIDSTADKVKDAALTADLAATKADAAANKITDHLKKDAPK